MENYLKVLLTFVLLSISMGRANGNLWDMYANSWPSNMGPTDTIYSLKTKMCFCGFDTSLMPENRATLMELYKLAHNEWNWSLASKNSAKLDYRDYNDDYANANYLGSSMWYSPFGGSWVSYKMPRKQMEAVMKGWVAIAEKGGVTIDEPSCKEWVAYFADNWATYPTFKIEGKTPDEKTAKRDEFYAKHGVEKFDYLEKNKFKRSFPVDLTTLKPKWSKKVPKEIDMKVYYSFDKVNAIVCSTGASRETDEEGDAKKGYMVFIDQQASYKAFTVKGEPKEYDDAVNATQDLSLLGSKFSKHMDKKVSNKGAMWNVDSQLKDNPDDVKANMLFPSTFMYRMCTLMLNPEDMGDIWGFNLEEVTKMYDYYSLHCPMMAMIGKLKKLITKSDGSTEVYETTGMYGIPDQGLFPEKESGSKALLDKKYYDIGIDADSINFDINGDYTAELERLHTSKEEAEKARQEKMEEENKDDNQSITSSEHVDIDMSSPIIERMSNESHDEQTVENQDEDNISMDSPSIANEFVVTNVNDEVKASSSDDLIFKCKNGIKIIENRLQDQVQKKTKDAIKAVYDMLSHPHDSDGCLLISLLFINLNEEKEMIEVTLRENGMPVMNMKLEIVNPLVYNPKEGDTKVVYQMIFWNHFFEDQQDALYYIPDREIVNEWDKYHEILKEFKMFTDRQNGMKLTLDNIFSEFQGHMEENVKHFGFEIDEVGTDHTDSPFYSPKEHVQEMFMYNAKYRLRFFQLRRSDVGFYDFVFQAWKLGEKYIMVKIDGTRFTYSVLINEYTPASKLRMIWDGIYNEFQSKFMGEGSQNVATLNLAKHMVYKIAHQKAFQVYKYGWKEAVAAGDGDDEGEAGYVDSETSIKSSNQNFYFSILLTRIDEPITIRGFVHLKENIPVINIFFGSEKFEAEYIIPLASHAEVQSYISNVFDEIYTHMYHLLIQIKVVEDEDITEEELNKNQKLGRYSMKKIILSMLKMLRHKEVFGCWKTLDLPASERNPDGTFDFNLDEEEEHKDASQKREYKWTKTPMDVSGDLLILRSNFEWTTTEESECSSEEMMNPVLIHLYPTWLDDRNGYALTINSPSADGEKELKTTYHFVKYQDYAHQKVLENFIQNIFDEIFAPKANAVQVIE